MNNQSSFAEQLFHGIGDAIADIRENHELAWFGREVTERGELPQWPESREAEQQPHGLDGEILGPESAHMPETAGHLEHGTVLDGQYVNEERALKWPEAREPEIAQLEHQREPDIER